MKYNFKYLQDFCAENKLICVQDYSIFPINCNTKITLYYLRSFCKAQKNLI